MRKGNEKGKTVGFKYYFKYVIESIAVILLTIFALPIRDKSTITGKYSYVTIWCFFKDNQNPSFIFIFIILSILGATIYFCIRTGIISLKD